MFTKEKITDFVFDEFEKQFTNCQLTDFSINCVGPYYIELTVYYINHNYFNHKIRDFNHSNDYLILNISDYHNYNAVLRKMKIEKLCGILVKE